MTINALRPAVGDLGARRAPNLHRTMPTWAREPLYDGRVQWRMYRRHRGGAIYVFYTSEAGLTREEVAAALRMHRKTHFMQEASSHDAGGMDDDLAPPAVLIEEDQSRTDAHSELIIEQATSTSSTDRAEPGQGCLF